MRSGNRRKARGLALQALYEIDSASHNPEDTMQNLLSETQISADNAEFVKEIVLGVTSNLFKVDEYIKRFASAWPIDQMAIVDS